MSKACSVDRLSKWLFSESSPSWSSATIPLRYVFFFTDPWKLFWHFTLLFLSACGRNLHYPGGRDCRLPGSQGQSPARLLLLLPSEQWHWVWVRKSGELHSVNGTWLCSGLCYSLKIIIVPGHNTTCTSFCGWCHGSPQGLWRISHNRVSSTVVTPVGQHFPTCDTFTIRSTPSYIRWYPQHEKVCSTYDM